MGRGDRKTRKGKIWKKSSGNARPRKKKKIKTKAAAAKTSEPTA
ncbi:MAG: 30S ribosomal protein THX [Candidatus Eisenbacteria bacterium]